MAKQVMILVALMGLTLSGCATTRSAWREAQRENTVQAYQDFLQKYPQSEFAAGATRKVEERAWQRAQQDDTAEGYRNFLSICPKSAFVTKAEKRIQVLERMAGTIAEMPQRVREGLAFRLTEYPNLKFIIVNQGTKLKISAHQLVPVTKGTRIELREYKIDGNTCNIYDFRIQPDK